jgi:hypothetical protein
MLLLLVAVMAKDGAQLLVLGCVHPLLIPVDRLQLLHQADDGAVHVAGLGPQPLFGFVKGGRSLRHLSCLLRTSVCVYLCQRSRTGPLTAAT